MSKTIKIGILRESGRIPPDRRSPLTPQQCVEAMQKYKNLTIYVEKSNIRCFSDKEFECLGLAVVDDLSHCDILLGIKEVDISKLIPEKTYLFFSHTLKKQPHNQKLLASILEKKIRLIDYECITDENSNRLIAFGFFAGIVGAYNGVKTYLKKFYNLDFKPAYQLKDLKNLYEELEKNVKPCLPKLRIAITGGGRVASGAMEVMNRLNIKQVTLNEFLNNEFDYPVYVQLHSRDYHRHKNNPELFDRDDFHHNPADYVSIFKLFTSKTDLLIAGAFWHSKAPKLFELEDMLSDFFKIKVIADITCDINGSIPCTIRSTTIENPIYDYDPKTGEIYEPFTSLDFITVMAVDNLPCELPRDSSEYFGERLLKYVVPALVTNDENNLIERATITKDGKLTKRFMYLYDYAYPHENLKL